MLIKRDAAIASINEWLQQTGAIPWHTSYHRELFGCIEALPTIDPIKAFAHYRPNQSGGRVLLLGVLLWPQTSR